MTTSGNTPFTAPPFILNEDEQDRSVYPHVVATTEMGDDGKIFATAATNNNDTTVKVYVYWYTPEDGPPSLVVEVDEDPPLNRDINLVVRRNDGLIHEALSADLYAEEGSDA